MPRLRAIRQFVFFSVAALGLSGCGGGGSQPMPLDQVTVVPATVEANFNTPVVIEGGVFEAPVVCQFVDDDGVRLGPLCDGRVVRGGAAVEMEPLSSPSSKPPSPVGWRFATGRVASCCPVPRC